MQKAPLRAWLAALTSRRAVLASAGAYVLFTATLSVVQHLGLRTYLSDLGNADRSLWAITQGDWLMHIVARPDGTSLSRLSIHVNFIYWLLAPLYFISPAPEQLLVLNALACGAAGLALHALARLELGETPWTAVPPLVFWTSPIVHDANLFDFRPIVLATALLLWAIWAFRVRRMRLGGVVVALALLCQEDVSLLVVATGAYFALTGRRRLGAVLAGVGLVYLALAMKVVLPAFQDVASQGGLSARRFGWLRGGGGAAPGLLGHLLRPDRLRVPVYLLLSGAVVAFRAWPILLLTLPQLGLSLLSSQPWPSRLTGTYYLLPSLAAIVFAVTAAAARGGPRRRWRLGYLAGVTLFLSFLLSPLPHGVFSSWANYSLSGDRQVLSAVAKALPPDAGLCVQKNLGPHLGHRRYVVKHPRATCEAATHALFHLRDVGGPDSGLFTRTDGFMLYDASVDDLRGTVRGFLTSPRWGLVEQREGFYLFERGVPHRVPLTEAIGRFERDARIIDDQRREASRHRWGFHHLFASPLSWREL
jgi:uncharacterized membrane protein